jgi:hypothetical protein
MRRIFQDPWRWAAAGMFILAGIVSLSTTHDAHVTIFHVFGQSAAFAFGVSGLGVLLDRERIATQFAIITGGAWFCFQGGLSELLLLTFGSIFGIGFIWLTLPLIGIAIAYYFVMRDS